MRQFFKKYGGIGLIIIFVGLMFLYVRLTKILDDTFSKEQDKKIDVEFYSKFDLNKVPNGLIIWKHGVPNTEINFQFIDSAKRYEYYDIGVLDTAGIVYCIRVPYYSIGMFQLGNIVINKNNMFPQKNNLDTNFYVYPNLKNYDTND
jgi:hypothetical protein